MTLSGKKNSRPQHPILIVDDQPIVMALISKALYRAGYGNQVGFTDEREVMAFLDSREVEIILLDLVMPYISGEDLLVNIRANFPEVPVIMATSMKDTPTIVSCMKKGAYDYITKPFDEELLMATVGRAIEHRELTRHNSRLSQNLLSDESIHPDYFAKIITNSQKMKALFRYCEATAPGKEPVLITGETGTGKELMARAFHTASNRDGKFVAVNVAGVDDHVFSDTLFGHEKGAFTGADKFRRGFINKASGGTLFLDEIGELSEQSQIKLLRVIQEKEYFPLGSDQPLSTDARIIIATHKNLDELQIKGSFRKDLFFRLRTHHMEIPPLRERLEDIPLLLEHFLKQAAREFNKKKPSYPPELVQLLKLHPFPGNIRELRAMVYDAVARHTSKVLSTEAFKKYILPQSNSLAQFQASTSNTVFAGLDTLPTLRYAAQTLVNEALHRAGNNQKIAAAILGISPPALNKRLKQRERKKNEPQPN